ncbi:hypothetical protein D3C71_1915660 [compost metagenome]
MFFFARGDEQFLILERDQTALEFLKALNRLINRYIYVLAYRFGYIRCFFERAFSSRRGNLQEIGLGDRIILIQL